MPEEYQSDPLLVKKQKSGRPENENQRIAFLKTCSFLDENDEEQLTIKDLIKQMSENLEGSFDEPYGTQYMKQKLIDYYGDGIFICNKEGKSDVVTLKETAEKILRQCYEKSKTSDIHLQKILIIEAAAKLIKTDIKSQALKSRQEYPTADDTTLEKSTDYLPDSLKLLLSKLFVGTDLDLKIASIGQCIMQAVRPRCIFSPLQIGLSVMLHHPYRSRFLIDTLHKLGFTLSYDEVLTFEKKRCSSFIYNITGPHEFVISSTGW